jgi:hypothetical protein
MVSVQLICYAMAFVYSTNMSIRHILVGVFISLLLVHYYM